jgi:hypothetical protein
VGKGRDRPRHQPKRKKKDKVAKHAPPSVYEPPMTVEVIKPKRKPKEPSEDQE